MGWIDWWLDPDYSAVEEGPEKYEIVPRARSDGGMNWVKVPKEQWDNRERWWAPWTWKG